MAKPDPIDMPFVEQDGPGPVEMPTVQNDGPPPVDMPAWPTPEAAEVVSGPDSAVVDQIRAAERAAQASVCHIPEGDLPDELVQALERRVEVNLAQYDGGEIRRVGSTDPEVRRLEAPFSKRRAAGSIDHHTQEGQS